MVPGIGVENVLNAPEVGAGGGGERVGASSVSLHGPGPGRNGLVNRPAGVDVDGLAVHQHPHGIGREVVHLDRVPPLVDLYPDHGRHNSKLGHSLTEGI